MNILPKIGWVAIAIINISHCPNDSEIQPAHAIMQVYPALHQLYEVCGIMINDPTLTDLEMCLVRAIIQSRHNIEVIKANCPLFLATNANPKHNLFCVSNNPNDGQGIVLSPFAEVTAEDIFEIFMQILNQDLISGQFIVVKFQPHNSTATMCLKVCPDYDQGLGYVHLQILKQFVHNCNPAIKKPDFMKNIRIDALIRYLQTNPVINILNIFKQLINVFTECAQDIPEIETPLANQNVFQELFRMTCNIISLQAQLNGHRTYAEKLIQEKADLEKQRDEMPAIPFLAEAIRSRIRSNEAVSRFMRLIALSNEMSTQISSCRVDYKQSNGLLKYFNNLFNNLFEHIQQTLEKKNIKDLEWLTQYFKNMTPGIFGVYLANCSQNLDGSNNAIHLSNNSMGKLCWTSTKLTDADMATLVPLNLEIDIAGISKQLLNKNPIYSILNPETKTAEFFYKPYEPQKTVPVASTSASSSSSAQKSNIPTLAEFKEISKNTEHPRSRVVLLSGQGEVSIDMVNGELFVFEGKEISIGLTQFFRNPTNKVVYLMGSDVQKFANALKKCLPENSTTPLIESFNFSKHPPVYAQFLKIVDDKNQIHIHMLAHNPDIK